LHSAREILAGSTGPAIPAHGGKGQRGAQDHTYDWEKQFRNISDKKSIFSSRTESSKKKERDDPFQINSDSTKKGYRAQGKFGGFF
jgi:hypothetical protein